MKTKKTKLLKQMEINWSGYGHSLDHECPFVPDSNTNLRKIPSPAGDEAKVLGYDVIVRYEPLTKPVFARINFDDWDEYLSIIKGERGNVSPDNSSTNTIKK